MLYIYDQLLYCNYYFNLYSQANLLEDHIRDLRRVIRPGFKRLNWNSLGINEFVLKCKSASISLVLAPYPLLL